MAKLPSPRPIACNNGLMRKATRRLGQLFDDVLEPSGLRTTQFGLLARIGYLKSPSIKELADDMVMDLSALGHTLKPLARDGYVVLNCCDRDRRAKRVSLTPLGEQKVRETEQLWCIAHERLETAFGVRKAEKLRKALKLIASDEFSTAFLTSTRIKRKPRTTVYDDSGDGVKAGM